MIALLALLACSRTPPPEVPEPAPAAARADLPNVVLITLDTTRADRLGAYGYAKAHTPNLDALAARGRRYDRAYSPIPLTIPAHATLFTGQLPPTHGVRANGAGTLPPSAETLAETLKGAGYRTAASVSAYVTTRRWGFDQGFDAYFDAVPEAAQVWQSERPAQAVIDDLLAWKSEQPPDGPEFVWAHLYDPHFPYLARPEWLEKTPERPYDAEIAYVDAQVGRLIDAYSGEPTVFVVVADHGEGLGEHGEATHGLFVYDTTQRVPYLLVGPGVEPGVVAEPVSLADVAPTLLDLLKLPALAKVDGRVAPGTPEKPVYLESWQLTSRFGLAPHVGVVVGDRKLIDLPKPEIYAATDPSEATNLADAAALAGSPGHVADLKSALASFGARPPDQGIDGDPAVTAQLEALGYVAGSAPSPDAALGDPKDHAELLRQAQLVDRALHLGRIQEADDLLAPLIEKHPTVREFKVRRARTLDALGKGEEALALVRELRQGEPTTLSLKHTEATLLARLGRYREAVPLFADVARQAPDLPRARAAWVSALLRSGDVQRGLDVGARELAAHPDDHALAGELGLAYVRLRQLDRALPLLEQGALASRPERDVLAHLAAAAQGRRDEKAAKELLARELRTWPDNVPARAAYVRLLAKDSTHAEELLIQTEILLRAEPKAVEVHGWRTQALFNLGRYDDARAAAQAGLAIDPLDPMLMSLQANLLAKEGKRAEGEALLAKAQAEAERRRSAAQATPPAPK